MTLLMDRCGCEGKQDVASCLHLSREGVVGRNVPATGQTPQLSLALKICHEFQSRGL